MAGAKRGGQGGRGAKPGSHRKGAAVGSGGQRRRSLEGRGPTPAARERKGAGPARERKAASAPGDRKVAGPARDRKAAGPPRDRKTGGPPRDRKGAGTTRDRQGGSRSSTRPTTRAGDAGPETVVGRNPVVEALRAGVPATALYVATGMDQDDRVREAVKRATQRQIAVLDADRRELDRYAPGAVHQGMVLRVPPFEYLHPDELLDRAFSRGVPLLVALDGVTDPHNLGAVVRSVAAFGGHGVLIPERRAAGMTASAWKASAGAAARVPVARATNLNRALAGYTKRGLLVVGLAADGALPLIDLEAATEPLVLVIGSEGKGLSRLVQEHCDLVVSIPISAATESLNASVAAGVVLYEVASRRSAARS